VTAAVHAQTVVCQLLSQRTKAARKGSHSTSIFAHLLAFRKELIPSVSRKLFGHFCAL
jgi:hypothetical protein